MATLKNIRRNAKAYPNYKINLEDYKKEEEKAKLTRPNDHFDEKTLIQ
jgi:hypothetical protein